MIRPAIVHALRPKLLLCFMLIACLLGVPLAARSRPIAGCALPPLAVAGASAGERGFVAADLYFVPWDVETVVAISLARMRDAAVSQRVSDPRRLDALVRRLQPDALRTGREPPLPQGDYRLLVVFTRRDGSQVSYAATYFDVMDPATRKYRPIDDSFRAAFTTGKW